MSPSTEPPFCSFTRTARIVPLTLPQMVMSCAITQSQKLECSAAHHCGRASPCSRARYGSCRGCWLALRVVTIPKGEGQGHRSRVGRYMSGMIDFKAKLKRIRQGRVLSAINDQRSAKTAG